jgi:hypothetical protein
VGDFKRIDVSPPQDHPHVYINMCEADTILWANGQPLPALGNFLGRRRLHRARHVTLALAVLAFRSA